MSSPSASFPPSPAPRPSVVCAGLRFAWPDGTPVFDRLDLVLGTGPTGLIGRNGSGKSTLLRLIAGELEPSHGSVKVTGSVEYLPQHVRHDATRRVDEVLGIAPVRAALRAIERGDVREEHFEVVADRWDVEERARATLHRLGLGRIRSGAAATAAGADPGLAEDGVLDRPVGELSGGESILLGLAAALLRDPEVLLLDEPTNNLDLAARRRLREAVGARRGTTVIVSHDRELLAVVDQIAELSDGEVRRYGGDFAAYEAAVATEQEAARRSVRAAEADVRRQRRELADARVRLDRRLRYGRKMRENKREPKVVMGERERQAQVSAGKYRNLHLDRLEAARDRLGQAEQGIRDEPEIRIDLPGTEVPAGRTVLVCEDVRLRHGAGTVSFTVRGPERIALVGANGAGKSTLLRTIAGELSPLSGLPVARVPAGHVPQSLRLPDEEATVAENVRLVAPGLTDNQIRARLARFLFRGAQADRPVGGLSGGERLRAALAAVLSAEPAPQLLLLDEPTNNLDLASVRRLAEALASYRGALLVVSHDLPFLREAGVTRWLLMDGGLREVDAI